MQKSSLSPSPTGFVTEEKYNSSASQSAVIWSAIIGGSLTTTVITLLLSSLVAVLGFATLLPFETSSEKTKAFAISGAIALIIIQWISAGLGGYLTGRLRTKYIGAHGHEVFFRDTAHGFLSWALAALVGLPLLALATAPMHGLHPEHNMFFRAHSPAAHYTDLLLGPNTNSESQTSATVTDHDQVAAQYIIELEARDGTISQDDKAYLVQLVSSRTGVSNIDAAQRVDTVLGEAKDAAEAARKYTAVSLLFIFFAMMIGAFVATIAGALGGHHRDLHYTTGTLSE